MVSVGPRAPYTLPVSTGRDVVSVMNTFIYQNARVTDRQHKQQTKQKKKEKHTHAALLV